jgi:O-antigen/teichoic acid export membrane protein
LLGARYMDSAQVLKYLIWASIPMYLNFALNIGLLATGRERVFLLTSSICLAVNFVGNLVLIPRFSWRAAAVLTIATELVLLAQNVYWIRRAIGRVPLPWGGARTSLAFVVLMAAALGAGRFVSMPLVGTVCLLFFILYLHRSEMLAEFARVWRARNTVGEPSCPS